MHSLQDEIKFADDTRCYEVTEFDGTMILIEVLGTRSVTQVAQRLGIIDKSITVHGDVTGQVDGQDVVITKNAKPHLNSQTVTGYCQL